MYIKKIEILIYNLIQFFFSNNVQNTIANIINNSEFSSHIKKIIFDVGSYKGDWSLKMEKSFHKKSIKNLTFYLFEPNPLLKNIYNVKFKRNFKQNNIACSNKKKIAKFQINNFMMSSGSSLDSAFLKDKKWIFSRKLLMQFLTFNNINTSITEILVKADKLDNYCKKKKIKYVDILKIDVEGSEKKVLEGSLKILKNTKIIFLEITSKKKIFTLKENNILNYLKKKNFYLYEKYNIANVSFFSNLVSNDYLLLNNTFLPKVIKE